MVGNRFAFNCTIRFTSHFESHLFFFSVLTVLPGNVFFRLAGYFRYFKFYFIFLKGAVFPCYRFTIFVARPDLYIFKDGLANLPCYVIEKRC